MKLPTLSFAHLLSMSTPLGTYEHCAHSTPRVEHGYCTDDVARVLLVVVREPHPTVEVAQMANNALGFLGAAQGENGQFRNRRRSSGTWFGPLTSSDWWGRAMWALGTAVARSNDEQLRVGAQQLFERGAQTSSSWTRSSAFAALGAGEILSIDPTHVLAKRVIGEAARVIDQPELSDEWRWPEERLTYANATLPEARMVIGSVLGDDRLVQAGLRQLQWLLDLESTSGHLSVTPAGGRGRDFDGRKFDQQPIEVAAMSDACVRAFELTGNAQWLQGHDLAAQWFAGRNDVGVAMYDPLTGGGYDGLTADGPNFNQGAESTIALLTTLQHARRFEKAAS